MVHLRHRSRRKRTYYYPRKNSVDVPDFVLEAGGQVATLDLDFVYNRGWSNREESTASSLLTCTRNSIGTYTTRNGRILNFTANQLRIGNRGVLVEEARTNLLLRSQEIGNAAYDQNVAITVTSNSVAAPDGTTTAETATKTADVGYRGQTVAKAASAITYTWSIYVKKLVGSFFALELGVFPNRVDAVFNLDTGSISTAAAIGGGFTNPSATIEALADGWYRLTVTATSDTATSIIAYFEPKSNNAALGETDSATNSSAYVWGAQLEAGAFPTSYIPTVASAVTRAADNVAISSVSAIDNDIGTLFSQAELVTAAASGIPEIWHVRVDATNELDLYVDNAITSRFLVTTGGVTQAQLGFGNVSGGLFKLIAAYAINDTAGSLGGGSVATDASCTMPASAVTSSHIGSYNGSSNFWNSYIQRVTYWNTRVPDASLQSITAVPAWLLDYEVELDFDFENDLGYLSGALVDLDTALTCARNHTSYYTNRDGTLTSVAANTLRKGDRGLLVEEARTNLVFQSQTFQTTWVSTTGVVTANTDVAPDGTSTADDLSATLAAFPQVISNNISVVSGTTYAVSIYVKRKSGTPAQPGRLELSGVGFTGLLVEFTLTDNWQRVVLVGTADGTATGNVYFCPDYSLTATIDVAIWGAQVEAGAFPTSYIPTTTVAVTRPRDVITPTVQPPTFYNNLASTFFIAGSVLAVPVTDKMFLSIGNTGGNGLILDIATFQAIMYDGTSVVNAGDVDAGVRFAYSAAFETGGMANSLDGASVVTGSFDGSFGEAPYNWFIGGASAANGHIPRLTYWRQRKVNAHLSLLTS